MIIRLKDIAIQTNPHTSIISHTVKHGISIKSAGFKIKYININEDLLKQFPKLKILDCTFCAFSTIVPKKKAKKAVDRNYYKRYIRHLFINQCTHEYKNKIICVIAEDVRNITAAVHDFSKILSN
ncbi:ribonuclease P protein component [Candidatus Deianiraea vastatrix]|uniref:Ribonuclease P protein component n=1 Tax=Candidatus Deianiraea vastatrix TaxID=2163644 RepID=A0A5B8XFL9_9RICK|nr:ribonuclease P protein component [Candidatus Deianiraea vastatrix]QED23091.1 Putative ribonuclease P protein component [Candidatus Deianiraea vastatrix]